MEVIPMSVSLSLEPPKIREREDLLDQFLEKHGLEEDELLPLAGDASQRRYFLLSHALIMDAAPPHEDTKTFENITQLLQEAGLTVPKIYAADHKNGFMLLEDFGDLTYRKALQDNYEESLIYKETINSLAHLHKKMKKNNADLPFYDLDLFLDRASLFTQWSDLPLSQGAKDDFKGLWTEAFQNQPAVPQRLMLRDVMVDNLFWLPHEEGHNRCGFIDYQDARWGPVTYDLVSLLEDARRDVAPDFAQSMLTVYFSHFPKLSREDFMASYCLWGAQRSTRILGVFSRLAKRDGKPKYLEHVPRVWAYLERDLQHPSLADLKDWFEKVRP
jgi:aminoglycoside/choline kinase family phosphotransferase